MIGTQIGSYRILEKLGEGGMGTVYKAVDTALDRNVAIKVLSSDLAGNQELVERFRSEARAQANLNHTNLATLYAFVIQDGRACMVMELVDGETFEQIILRRGAIPPLEALPLFKQALLGIGYAHRAGIVHRDIKPSNLMVNRLGIVKVMDFGIAKVMGARGMTKTGTQMGTGWYMSPEQVLNRPVDFRSDIYSLGVTLYQMITAHVPFDGPSDYQIMTDQVNTPPPLPTSFTPGIPKGVENAILKALAKSPDQRFQTVEEFGAALERPEDFGVGASTSAIPVAAASLSALAPASPAVPAVPPAPIAVAPRGIASIFATTERKIIAGAGILVLALIAGWFVMRPRVVTTASGPSTIPTVNRPDPPSSGVVTPDPSQQPPPTQQTVPPLPPVRKSAPAVHLTPQITFTATPPVIPQGGTARLHWHLMNAQTARIVPAPGVLRQLSGESVVAPAQTTTYTLTAVSKDGTANAAIATVTVIPQARPSVAILVHHDHGFAPAGWPQCWGNLVVMNGYLQYRVIGTNDGRRDDFNVPVSQIQEVRLNRGLIRNFPSFHATINGRVFNFVPQGMLAQQAVVLLQQRTNAR